MKLFNAFFRKIKTSISNPKWLLIRPLIFISPLMEESLYLKALFFLRTGYKLSLNNPRTFNEKLQWLKINYRRPIMTLLADKYEAKKYTGRIIGNEYVVKTFGIWDSFDQINFDKLPEQFVLKTTHDSGGIVICKDKKVIDYNQCRKKLNKHLRTKNYFITREWPYKNIKPRIIAEELLIDHEKGDLWDYKFLCFHGEPKIMYISLGRQANHVPFYFFDMNFNLLDIKTPHHEPDDKIITKPKSWEVMIQLSRKLSSSFPHVRVDFYSVGDRILLGEYTFFTFGGMSAPYEPQSLDLKLGDWIELENIEINDY